MGDVHNLSAPDMIVGWKEIRIDPPKQGQTINMMDIRGVITRGVWHPHASYSYEGKSFMPTHWQEAV
jgi:hypothetical protein